MLPAGFEFSQGNLQDYLDCKRRFQLRYLERQPWPAVEVEPALEREALGVYGQAFHRALERYYLGLSPEVVVESMAEEPLGRWWRAFMDEPPLNLPGEVVLPEARLVVTLAGRRLVAVFDLLAMERGRRAVIMDWKTGRRPERDVMVQRLQTMVYPFVLVEAGAHLFGEPIDPARVTMNYWFANYPDQPHVFHYDEEQHERIRGYLGSLVREVLEADVGLVWPLTVEESRCRFCEYRSLCDRGVVSGVVDSGWDGEDVGGFLWGDVFELVY